MSELLYTLLLQLYPRAFRERYQAEMKRLFRDRLRSEPGLRVWVDVLRDAMVTIPLQHWAPQPHPMYPPSAAPFRAAQGRLQRNVLGSAVLISIPFPVAMIAVKLMQPFVWWSTGFWITVTLTLLLFAIITWTAIRMVCQPFHALHRYRAIAGDESITVFYDGMIASALQRSEVVEAHEYWFSGIRIRATDPARDLWVPAGSAAYPDVKAVLGTWQREVVLKGTNPRPPFLAYPLWLLVLLLPAAFLPLKVSWCLAAANGITLLGELRRSEKPLLWRLLPLAGIVVVVVRSMP